MPEREPIGYGRQSIDQADIDAVVAILRSDWLTQGPAIGRFEQRLCDLTGASAAIAVCNATAALHIACKALDVGPGDIVWTSANSFVASANCALYCGAEPDFVDIDPVTLNMSVEALAAKLKQAAREDRLPKVVIPVHFSGESCAMDAIGRMAHQYGFRVIEDASHAVGGNYRGDPIGACKHSDITVFSFHPVKIVTTGEGGAALTNDSSLADRLRLLRSHGVTRDPRFMAGEGDGPWYYEQIDLGFNYRMTDIQAALGASQLGRIEQFIARRHELADLYDRLLEGLPLRRPVRSPDSRSALHLYVIQLANRAIRGAVFEALASEQIQANVHYIPIHLQPYYRARGFAPGDFPVVEAYHERALTLPLHPALSDADVERIVSVTRRALR
jgi:UDP-4-amino-4,6-dideoxy-N-acetyl-beta-L-altrosamine transaminase